MCRASNALNIKFEHFEWREDALCIYFAHMKNDQSGERPRDPRHVYANPLIPEICPILALGLLWITFEFENSGNSLFPGSNQYDRFRKLFQRAGKLEEIKNELIRRSMAPSDLGTHSMRKGAATYCSSGSTAGPSSSSIHLRAGWAMGGVQDTYIRYEAAGDMFVGRVVSGLPIDKPEFDVAGPIFSSSDPTLLMDCLKCLFKNIPDQLCAIGEKAMASLVYHFDFLQATLPASHPAKQSLLFRDVNLVRKLKPLIRIALSGESLEIARTGIPPHTSILREMKAMVEEIKTINPNIRATKDQTVEGVAQVLEERAIGAGTVTTSGLEEILSRQLSMFMREMPINNQVMNLPESNLPVVSSSQMFNWGGGLRRLPENFMIPVGTVSTVFKCWMIPNTVTSVCALRYCSTKDFNKVKAKRFCDLRKVMTRIESVARDKGLFVERPTAEETEEMITAWEEEVEIPNITPKGRIRRLGQLEWTYVLKLLRRLGQ